MNVIETIISQYGTSPIIRELIANTDEYIRPDSDLDAFFNYVWNVDTAQGFGLDIWGRIVNVHRELFLLPEDTGKRFGFSEGSPDFGVFGEAPFRSSGLSGYSTFRLSDSAFRTLIIAKAYKNITRATYPAINSVLRMLFPGRGNCYVRKNGTMSLEYIFDFRLEPFEYAILSQSGVLPTPCGVDFNVIQNAGAEIPEIWNDYTDNTFWSAVNGHVHWGSSHWYSDTYNEILITPTGSWSTGFRPTKIRLTYTGSYSGTDLYDIPDVNVIMNSSVNLISTVDNGDGAFTDTFSLDFNIAGDIGILYYYNVTIATDFITKIEFNL